MSTIQSRTPEKKAKNTCNSDLKISMKILFHYPPLLSSNSKILKLFPPKLRLLNAQQKKKMRQKSEKRGEARKRKLKVKTAVSLLNTNFEKLFVS